MKGCSKPPTHTSLSSSGSGGGRWRAIRETAAPAQSPNVSQRHRNVPGESVITTEATHFSKAISSLHSLSRGWDRKYYITPEEMQ